MSKNNHLNTQQNAILHHEQVSYSGPLPPAVEFDRYEKTCPGAAERILSLAEKESIHRHGIENILVSEQVRASKTVTATMTPYKVETRT